MSVPNTSCFLKLFPCRRAGVTPVACSGYRHPGHLRSRFLDGRKRLGNPHRSATGSQTLRALLHLQLPDVCQPIADTHLVIAGEGALAASDFQWHFDGDRPYASCRRKNGDLRCPDSPELGDGFPRSCTAGNLDQRKVAINCKVYIYTVVDQSMLGVQPKLAFGTKSAGSIQVRHSAVTIHVRDIEKRSKFEIFGLLYSSCGFGWVVGTDWVVIRAASNNAGFKQMIGTNQITTHASIQNSFLCLV